MNKGLEVLYACLFSVLFVTGLVAALILACCIVPIITVLLGVHV